MKPRNNKRSLRRESKQYSRRASTQRGGNGYLRPSTFHQDQSVPGALSSARFYPREPIITNEEWGGISSRNVTSGNNNLVSTKLGMWGGNKKGKKGSYSRKVSLRRSGVSGV